MSEHPWFKQYRMCFDDADLWSAVEAQAKQEKVSSDSPKEKMQKKKKKCVRE